MNNVIVADAHQSGFHGVTQDQWTAMNHNLAKHAHIGVVTESVGFHTIDGWDCTGNETKIVFDTSHWAAHDHDHVTLHTPTWKRGTSTRSTVEIEWALLRNLHDGVTVLRVGGHLPAHLIIPSQRAANSAALSALGLTIARLKKAHKPDLTNASFDFNRNLKLKRNARRVRRSFVDASLRLVVPPDPTHGLFTIDGLATSARMTSCQMLDRMPRFDHRGFAVQAHVG